MANVWTYTVKYVNEADDCIYTLTFNQDEKTCVLESYEGNPFILSKQKEKISIDNLLPQLKQRELLENWKPTWLTYTDYELALPFQTASVNYFKPSRKHFHQEKNFSFDNIASLSG